MTTSFNREGLVTETWLSIDVVADGRTVTLVLDGELDLGSEPSLRSCVDTLDGSWDLVILDLANVTFMDSTGVALIARLYTHAAKGGHPEVQLQGARGPVLRVLEMTGFGPLAAGVGPGEQDPAA